MILQIDLYAFDVHVIKNIFVTFILRQNILSWSNEHNWLFYDLTTDEISCHTSNLTVDRQTAHMEPGGKKFVNTRKTSWVKKSLIPSDDNGCEIK